MSGNIPQKQLENLISLCQKLSHHYASKYPQIGYDEFYSLSLEVLGRCLKQNNCQEEYITKSIYNEFHNFIKKNKQQEEIKNKYKREEMYNENFELKIYLDDLKEKILKEEKNKKFKEFVEVVFKNPDLTEKEYAEMLSVAVRTIKRFKAKLRKMMR